MSDTRCWACNRAGHVWGPGHVKVTCTACGGTGQRATSAEPPAETEHGLPFAPPENEEPTCPTCGQALFTHGIVGRCIPPEGGAGE